METAFGLRNSGTEASDWALSLGAYSGRGEPGNPAEMEKSRHSGFRPSPPPKKKQLDGKAENLDEISES